MPPPLPAFMCHPFTRDQALAAGFSDTVLRGKRFRRLFRGIYISAAVGLQHRHWMLAAVLAMPAGSVVSHVTAMRLYGFDIGAVTPFHVSTSSSTHTRHPGIRPHQRKHVITPYVMQGVPVTGPDRTLIDIATKVTLVELVQATEVMLHRRHTTMDALTTFALTRHLDGVRRVRRVLGLVRENVESPMETLVRLMIVFARLPEPRPNPFILDEHDNILAKGDLVYAQWKILVEYDGWQHERDADQRQSDVGRRERLERNGWLVIVITVADLKHPRTIVRRVHTALLERGYAGPAPRFSLMWDTWFAPRPRHVKMSAVAGQSRAQNDPEVPTHWWATGTS
ncbi:DUF559 domain-containing protein [Aeromicrobium sp.]|uniref:DUF559 domain-containing protein n=1 Tax=Aeromicrobium sp. TaxID=1871063 RepID=UPI002623237A|nr:DUF559 domain-containing protein [Aeromicrobium sp.]